MRTVISSGRFATLWWDLARIRPASPDWSVVLALVVIGIAAGLYKLGDVSLWGDEVFSVGLVSNSLPQVWNYVWNVEANMALYHGLLWAWLSSTGALGIPPTELVVRLPSVVCAVLAALVVFLIGRRFWSVTVGTIGAALLTLNNVELLMAREARSYSLEVLLVCVGWYELLVAMSDRQRRRRWWVAYAAVMTLAVYAHLFSALVLAAQVGAFAALLVLPTDWRDRARRSLRPMAASVAAISVAIIPLVVFAARHGSSNTHVPPSSPAEVARALWNISGHNIAYGLLLAAAVSAGAILVLRARRNARPIRALSVGATALLACWLAIPFAIAYAASQPGVDLHLFAWGYLVVIVPALCLLAGVGVASLGAPALRVGLGVSLIAAAALAMPPSIIEPAQDFRAASAWITERYAAGDGLVCASWSCALATDYYARTDRLPAGLLAGAPGRWSWSGPARALDADGVPPYAAGHARTFLVESLLGGDTQAVKDAARAARAWLDTRYPLIAETVLPSSLGPVTVRLYATGTAP